MRYSSLNLNNQFLFALFSLIATIGFSQDGYQPAVESFESKKAIDSYEVLNGKLSQSEAHRMHGKSSLQWDWTEESTFGTSHFKILSHDESPLEFGDYNPASPTLQMSIYNETPQDGTITIAFEKNRKAQVHFDINIDFKGWRRIWVPFYEMQGNPPKKGKQIDYDYFKVSTALPTGKLFFDDITFSQFQDDRFPYPDEIVPFIKANQKFPNHWMPLIVNFDRIKNLASKPISDSIKLDLKKIEDDFDQDMTMDEKYKLKINTLREDFKKLGIKDNGKTVLGPPLTFREQEDYYDEKQQGPKVFNEIQSLGKVLKKISSYYDRGTPAEQEEMKTMFLVGTKYFLDQGWVAGSSGGTRHHIGYKVREITEAFFMMRQVLFNNGLLKEVGGSLQWLSNFGMLLDNPSNFQVNIDYLNTRAYHHLMLVFLFEKQEEQAELVQAYSNYLSITLAQKNEEGGFKVDGTAWHHNGHYPAYALGAFQSVPKIIRTLSDTGFRVLPEGHANFKNSFLAARIYSQLYSWGFGNSGRHPFEGDGIQSLKNQYLQMAYSGNPEGTSKIDKEVAAAYLRLWGKEDKMTTSAFTDINGIQKEKLSGYYTFPYAATGVHRRNDWAALIKGYSKYVWASEIYVNSNRYGRYQANGTIQLLNSEGEEGSGFKQAGWDWNRYPGSSVIYLPLKELETKMPVTMFRSDETFAGTTKLNGNGIFGMILNESKGSSTDGKEVNIGFPGKLRAKKSVFSFEGKLIAIGTDISSIDRKNATQTNLFQSFLENPKQALFTSEDELKKFPSMAVLKSAGKQNNWVVDPYGSGYYMLSDNAIHIKKEHQHSYHNKYSINTGAMEARGKGIKETEADYATAWIDHGLAPKDASYQYVIYPFLNKENQKNFGNIIKKDESYAIERADSIAHIVLNKEASTTGYVVFEANQILESGILKEVSAPALVMIDHKAVNAITISAVQPDLNFPEYEKGRFRNYSQPVELIIILNGKWSASPADFIKNVDNSGETTRVTLECINGLPREFKMNKL